MSSWNKNPATIHNQNPQIVMVDTREILTISSTAQSAGAAGSKFYIVLPFVIVGLLICAAAGIITAVIVTKNTASITNTSVTETTTSILNASTTVATSVTIVATTIATTTISTLIWNSTGITVAGVTGSPGSANNELDYPYSVVRDASSGTIYIADFNNHRIMQYLSGASSGTVIAGGNGPGMNSTQLYYPVSIYLETSSNSFIICNNGANNIIRWVRGASSWTLIAGSISGASGSTSTLLNYPIGLAVDYMGNIYVADAMNLRVQFFLAGQSNGTTIAGVTGTPGSNETLFAIPYAVAIDSQLNLYVADSPNNRVQKFLRY